MEEIQKINQWYTPYKPPTWDTTSRGHPLKVVTSGTYRGPSGDPQGTNAKTDGLMKKLFFKSKIPCITDLFLFFTGRKNIQKF